MGYISGSLDPLDVAMTTVYVLSLFSNALFVLYLLIQRLRITVDRLVFVLCCVNLLITLLAVPVVHTTWSGVTPFLYGEWACRLTMPLFRLAEYSQGFTLAAIAYFVARKLNGDQEIKSKVVALFVGLHMVLLLLTLPLFGVYKLVDANASGGPVSTSGVNLLTSKPHYVCEASWPREAEIASLVSEVLMFIFSCSIAFYYFHRARTVVRYINERLRTQKSKARYQSFNKVMSVGLGGDGDSGADTVSESHLCFGESEEMNLEMNHLYQKHNTISSISKDDESSNISVQIFTNEVELDKIDRHSPLWRGPPRLGVYQKMVVSIKWFRYSCNLFSAFVVCFVVYALTAVPYHCFQLFTTARSPQTFGETTRTVGSVIFLIRLSCGLLSPWILMVGIFKFRKSIFGKCYRKRKDFMLLPDDHTSSAVSETTS